MNNNENEKDINKSDSSEVDKRINSVYRMLLAGLRTYDIISEANRLEWHLSKRQVQNYIARAKIYIDKENEANREYEFNKALARYEDLYAKALKVQDIKTAAKIIEQKSKLLNLFEEPDKLDQSINITHNFILNEKQQDLELDNEFDN